MMDTRELIFLWSWSNEEHIRIHEVGTAEAESVVSGAQPPYPEMLDDRKYAVRGPTPSGRMLQVISVLAKLEDVQSEEYQRLPLHQRIALEDGEPGARIIHARDLTSNEKRQLRRRRRAQ